MAERWYFEVLPCRPAPELDECLTSYLLRLATANQGVDLWDLVRDLFPCWTTPQQMRLLRWEYPVDAWGRLPLRAQRTPADLARLTVAPWLAKFRTPFVVTRPGYRSPGNVLQGVVRPALHICPRCVQARPYVRLLWRLAPVSACLEHGCLLQGHCPGCGHPLAAIGPAQHLLRCARCGAEARDAPVVVAPAAVLAAQHQRQADLRFLLDPAVTLVAPTAPETGQATHPARALGRKCRYLRLQAGLSIAQMARRAATAPGMISTLELGQHRVPLSLYLAYLDVLALSWPEFAAVTVPPDFIRRSEEPAHLALRCCPSAGCPNGQPPPGIGVLLLADLPDHGIVRLKCRACGRNFTRRYDGSLTTKPHRPPLHPGDHPRMLKTTAEIDRLTELGLQGLTNRQIARQLGWGERTVRTYWIALGLEDRVHAVQAQRRAGTSHQQREALRTRIEAILDSLRSVDREITLQEVGRALGYNADYLQTQPDLAAYTREVMLRHNRDVRQRRKAALAVRITDALDAAKRGPQPLTLYRILRQIGLSDSRLRAAYPDLHARVHQAVEEDQVAWQTARRERHTAQINAAAARLVKEGVRLTYTGLLQAAGVDRYYGFRDPIIHNVLVQWIGDSSPRD